MYKYLLIAAFTTILIYLGTIAERRLAKTPGHVAVITSYVFVALVFCIFAGMRSTETGTDVEMYVVPSFNVAQRTDFVAFFSESVYAKWMPFSKLLFWVVPSLTHSLFWTLFAVHLVIVVPMLVALRLVLKEKAWLGVLVFGIAFFPVSLNIMRQFMGMGFILLSYVFVRKRKPWFFLLFIAIAALFHETCLLGLIVYPLWLLSSGKLKKIRVNPAVLALASLALVQVFFPALNLVAPYIGKFGSYINGAVAASGGGGLTELRYIVYMCVILGVLYMIFMQKRKADYTISCELSGLAAIVFFGVAVFSACLYSFQLFRLGFFFLYFAVLLIPLACNAIKAKTRRIEFAVVAVALLALFAQSYYGGGSHEVVPYVVDFAGKF